jgi:hypothetical protein
MAINEFIARAVLDADGTWRSQSLADHLQGTATSSAAENARTCQAASFLTMLIKPFFA